MSQPHINDEKLTKNEGKQGKQPLVRAPQAHRRRHEEICLWSMHPEK